MLGLLCHIILIYISLNLLFLNKISLNNICTIIYVVNIKLEFKFVANPVLISG